MRNTIKSCGLTIHQNGGHNHTQYQGEQEQSVAQAAQAAQAALGLGLSDVNGTLGIEKCNEIQSVDHQSLENHSKEQIGIGKQSKGHGSDKDPALHLGPKLLESAWKPTDAMKKKKDKLPPSDSVGKTFVQINNPNNPFSLFLWYEPAKNQPQVCVADVIIDGRKSRGWILKAGRKNGVCIKDIERKGSQLPLEFKNTPKKTEDKDGHACQGMIQAIFWRVMDADEGIIPDEGEKAISILQLHYSSLKSTKKKQPLRRLVSQEQENQVHPPSTFLSSPLVDPSRVYRFMDIDMVSSEQDVTVAKKGGLKKEGKDQRRRGEMFLASIAESDPTDSTHTIENSATDHDDIENGAIDIRSRTGKTSKTSEDECENHTSMDFSPIDETQTTLTNDHTLFSSIVLAAEPLEMEIEPTQPLLLAQESTNPTLENEKSKSRKRSRDNLSSSELHITSSFTPFRKRIPMKLQTDNQTTLTTLRITLDLHTTRSSLQQLVKSVLEAKYWEEDEWEVLEPEDTKSICWFGRDGVLREFDALDDQSVWSVEGLVIRV